MKISAPKPLLWAIVVCLALAGLVYVMWDVLWPVVEPAWNFLADKERMRILIESYGSMAPLIFMGFQVSQVFLAPVPGELTGLVGGYVFGWEWGMLYSTVALSLGSMINFFAGRVLGHKVVERWVPPNAMAKVNGLMKRQGLITCFILFLMPGFPKDYLCLALGITKINWRVFFVMCSVGRMPGTLMLSLQGAMVYQENYWSLLWITLIAVVFLAPAYIFREKIYQLSLKLEK